ncbi:lipase family protein [Actinomadura macrotermitis]|uniref:Putative inactive lipase n=1 Tax=Actinomadura macrotermitis TaxID=2585200 RepID=A0A7K0BTP3_9ACTN|nr:lipase family protein [Actinomadura macrotermitis]MQY04406.1 putative inactive lipase [Actinomadura macrotermitis]
MPQTALIRRLRGVPAVALGAVLAVTALPGGPASARETPVPPGQDAFYRPPSPLPAGRAGDVIRSRASKLAISPTTKAWQILYRTANATGAPIAVSGTVLVPPKPWTGPGARPLVSYAVGSRGIGDSCAPSYTMTTGLDAEHGVDYESYRINDLLNKGWAVAVTDMEGLGTPGPHTYTVGRSQGHAVLDIARAAERLPGTGLGAGSPVGVVGYSQGGGSAGWAAELAGTYAPELNLKGVVASGVLADAGAVGRSLDGTIGMGLAFMASVGYDAAYPELNLGKYLNDAGRRLKAEQGEVCVFSVSGVGAIANTAFRHIKDYTTSSPLDSPAWQARFKENRLGGVKPTVPVFQAHARLDEALPYAQADALHRDWCRLGANLTWKTYEAVDHILGFLQNWPDTVGFMTDRFAGRPVRSNC